MPLYEYKCEACDAVFEVLQSFSDEPLTTHEGCGGRLERLISPPAFHFKGSGWYVTDYARKNGGGTGSSSSKHDLPKAETKTETKTESKPAAETKK